MISALQTEQTVGPFKKLEDFFPLRCYLICHVICVVTCALQSLNTLLRKHVRDPIPIGIGKTSNTRLGLIYS